MEQDLDRIQPEFLEHTVKLNLVAGNGEPVGLESGDDFSCTDATVKVSILVRIGFDVDRLLADLIRQTAQGCQ